MLAKTKKNVLCQLCLILRLTAFCSLEESYGTQVQGSKVDLEAFFEEDLSRQLLEGALPLDIFDLPANYILNNATLRALPPKYAQNLCRTQPENCKGNHLSLIPEESLLVVPIKVLRTCSPQYFEDLSSSPEMVWLRISTNEDNICSTVRISCLTDMLQTPSGKERLRVVTSNCVWAMLKDVSVDDAATALDPLMPYLRDDILRFYQFESIPKDFTFAIKPRQWSHFAEDNPEICFLPSIAAEARVFYLFDLPKLCQLGIAQNFSNSQLFSTATEDELYFFFNHATNCRYVPIDVLEAKQESVASAVKPECFGSFDRLKVSKSSLNMDMFADNILSMVEWSLPHRIAATLRSKQIDEAKCPLFQVMDLITMAKNDINKLKSLSSICIKSVEGLMNMRDPNNATDISAIVPFLSAEFIPISMARFLHPNTFIALLNSHADSVCSKVNCDSLSSEIVDHLNLTCLKILLSESTITLRGLPSNIFDKIAQNHENICRELPLSLLLDIPPGKKLSRDCIMSLKGFKKEFRDIVDTESGIEWIIFSELLTPNTNLPTLEKYVEQIYQNLFSQGRVQSLESIQLIYVGSDFSIIKLPNDLEVIISQRRGDASKHITIKVEVNAGLADQQIPGLAHLTEHVAVPLNFAGGECHATVDSSSTLFSFDLKSTESLGILHDYFSFFTKPTFDRDSVHSEIEAVDSEWHYKMSYERLCNLAFMHFLNDGPASNAFPGDKISLNRSDIMEQVLEFWNNFYHAENMVISLSSHLPSYLMDKVALLFLSSIPSRGYSLSRPLLASAFKAGLGTDDVLYVEKQNSKTYHLFKTWELVCRDELTAILIQSLLTTSRWRVRNIVYISVQTSFSNLRNLQPKLDGIDALFAELQQKMLQSIIHRQSFLGGLNLKEIFLNAKLRLTKGIASVYTNAILHIKQLSSIDARIVLMGPKKLHHLLGTSFLVQPSLKYLCKWTTLSELASLSLTPTIDDTLSILHSECRLVISEGIQHDFHNKLLFNILNAGSKRKLLPLHLNRAADQLVIRSEEISIEPEIAKVILNAMSGNIPTSFAWKDAYSDAHYLFLKQQVDYYERIGLNDTIKMYADSLLGIQSRSTLLDPYCSELTFEKYISRKSKLASRLPVRIEPNNGQCQSIFNSFVNAGKNWNFHHFLQPRAGQTFIYAPISPFYHNAVLIVMNGVSKDANLLELVISCLLNERILEPRLKYFVTYSSEVSSENENLYFFIHGEASPYVLLFFMRLAIERTNSEMTTKFKRQFGDSVAESMTSLLKRIKNFDFPMVIVQFWSFLNEKSLKLRSKYIEMAEKLDNTRIFASIDDYPTVD